MAISQLELASAIRCPHPEARSRQSIGLQGRDGRWMLVCRTCSETMKACVRQWHAYSIRIRTVFGRLRQLEYSRRDALQFCCQLLLDRAQVRLGLLPRSAVDV